MVIQRDLIYSWVEYRDRDDNWSGDDSFAFSSSTEAKSQLYVV